MNTHNNIQRHRSTDRTPRSDGSTTSNGEERTSLISTSSADEGQKPDCAKSGNASGRKLKIGQKIRIGTWNVRTMSAGTLENVIMESRRYNISCLGICEHRWGGQGHFTPTNGGKIIYAGKEKPGQSGVAIYLEKNISNSLMGYNPYNDRVLSARLRGIGYNITLIQVYAPTSVASEEEKEEFYATLQQALDACNQSDRIIIMGDFNSKVGSIKDEMEKGIVGSHGLGERNESGEGLVEFAITNNLTITNTMFKTHKRRLYTWTSPDGETKNQIDYILTNRRWKTSVTAARTLPGADCGTDHELLMAEIKLRLKKIKIPPKPARYDLSMIHFNITYKLEIKNRFSVLQEKAEELKPDELAEEIEEAFQITASEHLPKKLTKKKPWISNETLNAMENRRIAKQRFGLTSREYKDAKQNVKRLIKKDKSDHFGLTTLQHRKCNEIQPNRQNVSRNQQTNN